MAGPDGISRSYSYHDVSQHILGTADRPHTLYPLHNVSGRWKKRVTLRR